MNTLFCLKRNVMNKSILTGYNLIIQIKAVTNWLSEIKERLR